MYFGVNTSYKKKMAKQRKKILTNKLFQKLWTDAEKQPDKSAYIKSHSQSSSKELKYAKNSCRLKYTEYVYILNEIHEKQWLSFKEIIHLTGKRKADISKTFCIPIRTIEAWYKGDNNCASYIKLMILRHYHLLDLGKYIYTECDEEYVCLRPRIYNHNESKKTYEIEEEGKEDDYYESLKIEEDNDNPLFDEIDKALEELRRKREFQKYIPVDRTTDIIEKTNFIDDILKRKNK